MTVGDYVTFDGLEIPTLQDILDLLTADERGTIDANLDTSPESPMGQINGIAGSHIREGWEAIQIAYHGNDPDAAEGYQLDSLSAITGTTRPAATPSTFAGPRRVRVSLNAATTLNAGALFSQHGNPQIVFRSTENVTSTTAADYLVAAECTQVGPVSCPAGTLTVIQTPVAGLTAVTNDADAVLGTNEATDGELRILRKAELALAQAGTPAAVTAALLAFETDDLVHPILGAITYENTSDFFDVDGRPPHCIEALIYDGDVPAVDNNTIAQLIWNNRGGGIATFGNSTGVAVDYLGVTRIVSFSRAVIQAVKLSITLDYDQTQAAPDPSQVADAMVVAHDAIATLGVTALRWNIFDASAEDNVPGVLGATNIRLGNVGGLFLSTFTNLPIPSRTKTTLAHSDVTVILTPASK